MPLEKILVAVKTYPTLSRTYGETVCTAGVRADGSWVRLYPIPYRRLDDLEKYHKYDWIECIADRNRSDPRPETYRPAAFDAIRCVGKVDTSFDWRERRHIFLEKARVYTKLGDLIAGAKSNQLSLAVFKPKRIIDFICKEDSREWDTERLNDLRIKSLQPDLFNEETWREKFKVVEKIPYKFYYKFEDETGKTSTLRVLDWEAGQLFRNCRRSYSGDEIVALQKVRQKYFDEFLKTNIHFFLGTTLQFHLRSRNPWVIIGVFPVPHQVQTELFESLPQVDTSRNKRDNAPENKA